MQKEEEIAKELMNDESWNCEHHSSPSGAMSMTCERESTEGNKHTSGLIHLDSHTFNL